MHRSHSTIGSFTTQSETSKKSKWRSLLGNKESRDGQSLTKFASISHTHTAGSQDDSVLRSSTSKKRASQLRKRMSVMLPSELSSNYDDPLDRLSDFKVAGIQVTDPKEMEFYSNLFSAKAPMTIEEEDYNEDSAGPEPSPNIKLLSKEHYLPKISGEDQALSSALEDYKLFTSKTDDSPTSSEFSHQTKTSSEHSDIIYMPSVPSFTSERTLESSVSIMSVSNSLWVGSCILDEENIEDEKEYLDCSDFLGLNSTEIFDEVPSALEKCLNAKRTSLIFY